MEYLNKDGLTYLWRKIKEEISSQVGSSSSGGGLTEAEVQALIDASLEEVENGTY